VPSNLLTAADYRRSVVAVPPIAFEASEAVSVEENRRIVAHIAAGGIATLLYGGNANLYHFGDRAFRQALSVLAEACAGRVQLLFSIGPDFGKAMDQIPAVRQAGVHNVMLLPTAFPSDAKGVAEGVRRIAEKLGTGIVLYVKRDGYVAPDDLARLTEEGAVTFVKYAVERERPGADSYLDALIAALGKEMIASGMGETPIHDHIGRRGLATFTSGAACIAPAAANALLASYRAGETEKADRLAKPFLDFERERARLGGIAVLHDAVTVSGIADCGCLLPMVSNLDEAGKAAIAPLVEALQQVERDARTARPQAASGVEPTS